MIVTNTELVHILLYQKKG